jgi:hypothetical protein
MAIVHAMVTSKLSLLTNDDRGILHAALLDLHARGFSLNEAKATLRRLRNKLVEPADRAGEPAESTSGATVTNAEHPESAYPF